EDGIRDRNVTEFRRVLFRSKTEVPVEKVWQGAEEDSVTINLLANDEPTEQSLELSAANDWADLFTDLDAFDEEGNPITYAFEEVAIDGYESEITGDATDGFVVTNTRTGETSVDITKAWKDEDETDRPEAIIVNLLANDLPVSEHEVKAADGWTLTIDELPKYDELGEEIEYSITEQDVPGYESSIDGFDITNTRV